MADKRFKLEIITPEEVIFSSNIYSLRVPAHDGELGVLPGHAPLLASLNPGIVRVRRSEESDREEYFSISGGFLDVGPEQSIVLADACERPDGIDLDRAEEAYIRAFNRLHRGGADEELDRERAEEALRRARARLETAREAGKDIEIPQPVESSRSTAGS